jgi:hypothetical protein
MGKGIGGVTNPHWVMRQAAQGHVTPRACAETTCTTSLISCLLTFKNHDITINTHGNLTCFFY